MDRHRLLREGAALGNHVAPFAPIATLVLALLCAQPVAADARGLACSAPQKPMLDIELLLGRGKADRARWRAFLAREVTPRFPAGLTVYDTYGQWHDPKRRVIAREQSRVLRIIVPPGAPAAEMTAAVADAYKRQFRQKSVGIVIRAACVSF